MSRARDRDGRVTEPDQSPNGLTRDTQSRPAPRFGIAPLDLRQRLLRLEREQGQVGTVSRPTIWARVCHRAGDGIPPRRRSRVLGGFGVGGAGRSAGSATTRADERVHRRIAAPARRCGRSGVEKNSPNGERGRRQFGRSGGGPCRRSFCRPRWVVEMDAAGQPACKADRPVDRFGSARRPRPRLGDRRPVSARIVAGSA